MKSKISAFLRARLRKLRMLQDLTQEAYAEMAGMSYKYYQAIESGRKKDIRISTVEKIADSYGVTVSQLLAPELPHVKLTGKKLSLSKRKAKPRIR